MSGEKPHVQLIRSLGWESDKILEAARGMTSEEIRDVLPFVAATGSAGARMDAAREARTGLLRERESLRLESSLGATTKAVLDARDEIEKTRASVEAARVSVEGTGDEVKALNASSSRTAWIAIAISIAALLVALLVALLKK